MCSVAAGPNGGFVPRRVYAIVYLVLRHSVLFIYLLIFFFLNKQISFISFGIYGIFTSFLFYRIKYLLFISIEYPAFLFDIVCSGTF